MNSSVQISASTDDAYRKLDTSAWSLTEPNWVVGGFNSNNHQFGGGGRFNNVVVPQGATIVTAKFTITNRQASYNGIVKSRISAEDVDDAATFADDSAAFDTRWAARTTARVDWDLPAQAWADQTEYDSPEIKTIIQEIVNRVGWVSGNSIVIFWDDFDDRTTQGLYTVRDVYSYDNPGFTAYAPKLSITYLPVAGNQGYIIG